MRTPSTVRGLHAARGGRFLGEKTRARRCALLDHPLPGDWTLRRAFLRRRPRPEAGGGGWAYPRPALPATFGYQERQSAWEWGRVPTGAGERRNGGQGVRGLEPSLPPVVPQTAAAAHLVAPAAAAAGGSLPGLRVALSAELPGRLPSPRPRGARRARSLPPRSGRAGGFGLRRGGEAGERVSARGGSECLCESPVPGARAAQSERRGARAGAEPEPESAAGPPGARPRCAPTRAAPPPRAPQRPLAPGPAPGRPPPSRLPRGGAGLAGGCHSGSSEPPAAAAAAQPPPPGTATMNPQCARCGKVVYPTEKVNCLDKYWHKGCFHCEVCKMALNMNNYKGYEKKPYCNAHYPKQSFTTVADTPENLRLKQQSELQSQVKYKRDFEESKGRGFSIVTDTPELQRLKRTQEQISNN
ncbi:translation initiation factor IF-2-like [Moschus berezovskii]|nr:translation initiation factor IF-2-like [Moschus berezovskii]